MNDSNYFSFMDEDDDVKDFYEYELNEIETQPLLENEVKQLPNNDIFCSPPTKKRIKEVYDPSIKYKKPYITGSPTNIENNIPMTWYVEK